MENKHNIYAERQKAFSFYTELHKMSLDEQFKYMDSSDSIRKRIIDEILPKFNKNYDFEEFKSDLSLHSLKIVSFAIDSHKERQKIKTTLASIKARINWNDDEQTELYNKLEAIADDVKDWGKWPTHTQFYSLEDTFTTDRYVKECSEFLGAVENNFDTIFHSN